MSKLNINKNEWLELVFEGKNKEYGAYKMRQDDGKTTMKAFFGGLLLLTAISSLVILLSSFGSGPVVEPTEPLDPFIDVTNVTFPPKEDIEHKVAPVKSEAQKPITSKNLTNPTVVKAEDAPPVEITKNVDLPKVASTGTDTPGTGIGPNNGGNTTGPMTDLPPAENPDAIKEGFEVEKNPAFPGGISEFLKIVGERFKAPEIDDAKIVKVLVYFVVERDGTLSNIAVRRNPGYGLDKEAIRVLKSIKTKWEPGIYKGKPVRTSYSLPISVQMQ